MLEVSGPKDERVLTIRIVNKDGEEKWTRKITAQEVSGK